MFFFATFINILFGNLIQNFEPSNLCDCIIGSSLKFLKFSLNFSHSDKFLKDFCKLIPKNSFLPFQVMFLLQFGHFPCNFLIE